MYLFEKQNFTLTTFCTYNNKIDTMIQSLESKPFPLFVWDHLRSLRSRIICSPFGGYLRHCATVSVIIQVSFDWPRDLRPRPWWTDLSLSLGQYMDASVWDFLLMTSISVDKWYVINDNTENNFCFIFCFSPFVGLSGNFTSSSLPRPPGND